MPNQIITASLANQTATSFAASFAEDDYYLMVGRHLSPGDDTTISTITDTDFEKTAVYDNMICGVKLQAADVSVGIERVEWQTGVVYPQYKAAIAATTHVTVTAGAFHHTYKCISNAAGSASTVSPSGTSALPFATADGYVWVYMFTVPAATYLKFSTDDTIPYVANTARIAASVKSTVDYVQVVDGGAGVLNAAAGTFAAADIKPAGATTYRVSEAASVTAGFYVGCILRIVSPASPAFGQYRTITGYTAARVATIDSAFSAAVQANDQYEIAPVVTIVGSGADVVNAVAIAKVAGGAITEVEMLSRGSGHRAATATLVYHPAATPSRLPVLSPVASPLLGHGADPVGELGPAVAAISTSINFSSIGIPSVNDYRTISIIKNPTLHNLRLDVTSSQPARFAVGEQLLQYREIGTIGAVSYNSNALTGTGTNFLNNLSGNPHILITSGSNKFITKIASVASATAATGTNAFAGTIAGTAQLIELTGSATVGSIGATFLSVNKATPSYITGGLIYGVTSRSSDSVSAINLNARGVSTYGSVIQAQRFTGNIAGTFALDEPVKASANLTAGAPVAFLHSSETGKIWLTNEYRSLPQTQLIGTVSSATITPTAKYKGDLTTDSGEILFVKHMLPVTKAANKATTVRLAFQF